MDTSLVRATLDPRTLRGRLTFAFAAALLVGLCAFAISGFALLHEMERATLDQQLSAAVEGTLGIIDEPGRGIVIDRADRRQLRDLLGLRLSGAIYAGDRPIAGTIEEIPPAVGRAAVGPVGFSTVDIGDDRVRVDVAPVIDNGKRLGTIVLWRPLEWLPGLDRRALLLALLTVVLVGLPAIVVGSLIARRGLRPLEAIATIASEIEAHDLTRRLDGTPVADDELGRLTHTFNRMLDRLQAAFERERRFTADASHELRAPLTVIAAETSLALRRERDAASYRRTIQVIAQSTRELQKLTDDLLAAARDEDTVADRRALDLSHAARAAAATLTPIALERHVEVKVDAQPGIVVEADDAAIGRAILAVMHNAVKFAPLGGRVRVSVERVDERASCRIVDNGPGFTREALVHATERFWRTDPARSPGSGSGLGLSIARAAVEQNGGTMTLENASARGHAVVALAFPLLPAR